ncbi:hypothetical protein GCM10011491_45960 [Brucella endophytica]|uniref:Uncharacterized protein n=4 Tax=Brucella endophytica TaxID=1963359 RepID=A0A916SRM7_9HYPH|nr:hypothetical protein GCM10011491_45960 [Brucella endophytica]
MAGPITETSTTAGAGTITVTPASTTTLHYGQILMVTASVVMTGGATILDGAQLSFSIETGFDAIGTGGKTQFVTNISADRTKGYAIFIGVVKSPSSVTLNVAGLPPTWAGSVVPSPSGMLFYNNISTNFLQITPWLSNPNLPVAPDNNQTPGSSGGKYTSVAGVTVTDSDSGMPVPDYAVIWLATGVRFDFFSAIRTFLDEGDIEPVAKNDRRVIQDDFMGDHIIGVTDSRGSARLYLVSTTQETIGGLAVYPPTKNDYLNAGQIAVLAGNTSA